MWKILEIGEKIEARDERYFPKDFAWISVNESMVGSPVVRTDHVLRRKISKQMEGQTLKGECNMPCKECGALMECQWVCEHCGARQAVA